MENRRLFLAVLLSMAVVIGWQLVFAPPPEERVPLTEDAPAVEESRSADRDPAVAEPREVRAASPEEAGGGSAATADAAAVDVATDPGAAEPAEPAEASPPIAAEVEERVVLEGEAFRAEFSNRGAQLVSFRLSEHENAAGEPLDMVRARPAGTPYPFAVVDEYGGALAIDAALFTVERIEGETGPGLVFRHRSEAGDVEKRFELLENGLIGVTVTAENVGSDEWGLLLGPGVRNPSNLELEGRFERRAAAWVQGSDMGEQVSDKAKEPTVVGGRSLSWVGLEDTYFLAVLMPSMPVDEAVITPRIAVPAGGDGGAMEFVPVPPEGPSDEMKDFHREMEVVVLPENDRFEGTAYLGAKDYERLVSLPWSLEQTVRFGWFGFLSRWLLVGLNWIHDNVVANYGWAIVLMTLLIKVVLLPLTHKSYVSMQKMQELAPRMKAIRSKYQGKLRDKKGRPDMDVQRKMNEEMTALYREEGVNPVGGCLPMLLQFPVLLAFYYLLSAAVELRGEPWILWIHDLSTYDPYFVLPVVMGAVQLVQQLRAPSGADPMQRRIMLLLPVFFTFLFLKFPSGLVLYWLTNNVLTLIQQTVYEQIRSRREKKGSDTPSSSAKQQVKGGSAG